MDDNGLVAPGMGGGSFESGQAQVGGALGFQGESK